MVLPSNRQLEAFVAVAELRSFRLASERMGLSQPALSQNITALEAHLNCALFARTTRSVVLTAEGAALHGRLATLLPALRGAIDHARQVGGQAQPSLSMGFLASAALLFLPLMLEQFRRDFPDVRVSVRDGSADGLFDQVEAGSLDLAVTSFLPYHDRNVLFEPILADPFKAVLRRDHRLANRSQLTWEDLMDDDFIGANVGSGTRHAIDTALQSRPRQLRTVMDFGHHIAVIGMVEAGQGLTALPSINVPPADHKLLCSIPLVEPIVTRDLGIVTSKADGGLSRYALQFRDRLVLTARNLGLK